MKPINRRQMMTSGAVAAAGGFGMMATGLACVEATGTRPAAAAAAGSARPGTSAAGPFIETRDGTRLFHVDWGTGAPVVFCHAWGLNADLWEYPMLELSERRL